MASYTIELKDVVRHQNIFAFPYPFYDEKKRFEFEKSFVRHFYFREICCPSVDRFMVYMEDKMNTVFPYYNELFKAATIDYSVLDNYNITESFKRRYENIGKTAGVSSTVGKVMDSQKSENTDERDTNTATENTRNGENVVAETTSNQGEENVQMNATDSELTTVTGNSQDKGMETKSSNTNVNAEKESTASNTNTRKFLDTPQGALDLNDNSYLTNLTQDNGGNSSEAFDKTNTTVNESTQFGKGVDSTTETDGEITKESETNTTTSNSGNRDVTTTDTETANGTGTEKTVGKTNGSFEGEQNTLQDSNTRTEMKHDHTEEYELTKRGNIGVDTDADMIQKHINLQRVLKQIEKMFFDECEDLFMMVY